MRWFLQLCLLFVLFGAETHAWGKVDVSETSRHWLEARQTRRGRARGAKAPRGGNRVKKSRQGVRLQLRWTPKTGPVRKLG